MSVKCMSRVWESSKAKGASLLILLAIADYAGDDGRGAFPSIKTLAKKSRMSERHVKRLIAALESTQELGVDRGQALRGTNEYVVKVGGVTRCHPRGDSRVTRGVTQESPDSSLNRQLTTRGNGASHRSPAEAVRERDLLFDEIARVCKLDPATAGSSIAKVKQALVKAKPPYTPEDVGLFERWWWGDKKMRERPPTLWQLKERIGVIRTPEVDLRGLREKPAQGFIPPSMMVRR